MEIHLALQPASDGSVQTDMIALGVLEAGKRAEAARDRSTLHQNLPARSGDPRNGAVQFAVAVQVDHGAGAAGLLEGTLHQRTRDAATLGREDTHQVAVVAEVVLLHPASKNRLVKTLCPVQIGAGNLEPRC